MAGNKNSGRKTILDEKKLTKIRNLVAAGNYAIVACQCAGISQYAYYDWLKKGERDLAEGKDTIYVKFNNAIKEAEAEAEARNLRMIQTASQTTWQAAAWYLERKHKDRWSAKQITELTGKDGGAIEIESPRERLERRIAGLSDRLGKSGTPERSDD